MQIIEAFERSHRICKRWSYELQQGFGIIGGDLRMSQRSTEATGVGAEREVSIAGHAQTFTLYAPVARIEQVDVIAQHVEPRTEWGAIHDQVHVRMQPVRFEDRPQQRFPGSIGSSTDEASRLAKYENTAVSRVES